MQIGINLAVSVSKCLPYVTSQFLCGVLDVTLVPYFSLASLCSVMLLSDNRNIMDYWMLVEGTVLNMFSCNFNVVEYNSIGIL